MQLCILIDTFGLEDHIYPRNFTSLDTHPEKLSAIATLPEAMLTDHTRHTMGFTLTSGGPFIVDFLVGDVGVPTLSSLVVHAVGADVGGPRCSHPGRSAIDDVRGPRQQHVAAPYDTTHLPRQISNGS